MLSPCRASDTSAIRRAVATAEASHKIVQQQETPDELSSSGVWLFLGDAERYAPSASPVPTAPWGKGASGFEVGTG